MRKTRLGQATAATVHGSFANSWRITDAQSLFTYGPGQDTSTFTDLSFPTNIFTINDVDASARDLAIAACASRGVVAGAQFDDCVLDVARTSNSAFADMATAASPTLVGLGDSHPNAAGELTETFEGSTVPPNFNSGQTVTDSLTSTFAGPFSGLSTYRFYVPSIPAHLQGQLAFDVVALGDWSDATVETVNVALNGAATWSRAFGTGAPSATATGSTAAGTQFAIYHVSIPFVNSARQLDAVFAATSVDGLAHKGFGIDNISFDADVVPAQAFGLGALTSAVTSVSNGVPGVGAGNLETPVSEDDYTFSLSAVASVSVGLTCPSAPPGTIAVWNLFAAGSTAALANGQCSSASLPAGNYRLEITSNNTPDTLGQYTLTLQTQPEVDVFALGALTPTAPLVVSNGVPGAGAGNLEVGLAQDGYRFTIAATATVWFQFSIPPGSALTGQRWGLINDVTQVSIVDGGGTDSPRSSGLSVAAGDVSADRG